MVLRTSAAPFALLAFCACGGGGGSSAPTMPTGTQTETFLGTAEMNVTGGCSNVGHPFNSGEGTVAIALTQSTGNVPVAAQVCHPSATNHATECTVPPFAEIGLGMTLRATLKGGRAQVLTIYPANCGKTGSFPASTVAYTVTVEHPR